MKKLILAGMLGLIVNTSSMAGERIHQLLSMSLEDLVNLNVTIATGLAQPLAKAPAVATVITAADIKAIGATNITQALETVPGLHVSTNFQVGVPIFSFRGMHSVFNPQVLIMVNGISINGLFTGNPDLMWKGMPVEAISRIEVIRGPGSAVYGADAFAGVINIITKTSAEMDGSEFGVRLGSFDTEDAWFTTGGKLGEVDAAFFLEYHSTDGHGATLEADAQTYLDNIYGTNASHAPGPVSFPEKSIDLSLDLSRGNWRLRTGLERYGDIGAYAGVARALDPEARARLTRWSADLTWDAPSFSDNWDLMTQLSYFDNRQEMEDNSVIHLFPRGTDLDLDGDLAPDGPFPDGLVNFLEHSERHTRLNFTGLYKGFEKHLIRLGVGWHLADLYKVRHSVNYGFNPATGSIVYPTTAGSPLFSLSDTFYAFMPEGDRKNHHVYIQDVWQVADNWDLTAGLRYDDFSDFGNTTNPRAALVWSTRDNLTIKLLYGKAFRSPSFTETRVKNTLSHLGNSNLVPETIQTVELAFDYRPTRELQFDLSLFHYDWENMIQYVLDPAPATTSTAQNAGRQTGHGLELAAKWQASTALLMQGNVAWQESTDEETGKDAGNAPNVQTYLRADWRFLPQWHLNTQVTWVGERKRASGDTRDPVDDYTTVDLTLRYSKNNRAWEVAVIARNLFDEDVREPSVNGVLLPNDLPQAGRSLFGEVRYRF